MPASTGGGGGAYRAVSYGAVYAMSSFGSGGLSGQVSRDDVVGPPTIGYPLVPLVVEYALPAPYPLDGSAAYPFDATLLYPLRCGYGVGAGSGRYSGRGVSSYADGPGPIAAVSLTYRGCTGYSPVDAFVGSGSERSERYSVAGSSLHDGRRMPCAAACDAGPRSSS